MHRPAPEAQFSHLYSRLWSGAAKINGQESNCYCDHYGLGSVGLGVNPAGLSLPVPAPPEGAAVCIVGGRGADLAPLILPSQKEGEMGGESHKSPRPAGLQEQ